MARSRKPWSNKKEPEQAGAPLVETSERDGVHEPQRGPSDEGTGDHGAHGETGGRWPSQRLVNAAIIAGSAFAAGSLGVALWQMLAR
jgi:hypothetical protein